MFTRLYAWLAGIGMAITLAASLYAKGRSDASSNLRAKQAEDANRRLKDAIEADSRGRERIARGELLNDDGHRRD